MTVRKIGVREWERASYILHDAARYGCMIHVNRPLSARLSGTPLATLNELGTIPPWWGADRILWRSDHGVVRITEDLRTIEDIHGRIYAMPEAMIPALSTHDDVAPWYPVAADYRMILPDWQAGSHNEG